MYLVIPTLLNDAEQLQIKELLNTATFTSGKITATGAALKVKNNEQLDREAYHTKAINQVLEKALMTSPIFRESTQPKSILPFLISRYYTNMEYGWHVDSPLMAVDQNIIRVDLSITIFLNAASEYEGGELEIETPSGLKTFKLNVGDAVIYPTTQLHRVKPVTDGVRMVAVSWIQSMIKSTEQRDLLFQLKSLQELLNQQQQGSSLHLLSQQVYSNLLRMFTDL